MADLAFCPDCGAPRAHDARFCASCGRPFEATGASPGPAASVGTPPIAWVPPKPRSGTSKVLIALLVVFGVGVLLLPLAFDVLYGLSTPDDASSPAPATQDAWTPPVDYELVDGEPRIAYRWLEDGSFACQITEICWGMTVIPHDGCPSMLYVEVAILDAAGAPTDMTNASAGAVGPDQPTTLVFENTSLGPHEVRIGQVSCL